MAHFLSRRTFTASGAAAIGVLSVPHLGVAEKASETLAEAGGAMGIAIGSAIRSNPRREVAAVIAHECAFITPENALKPGVIAPAQGEFRWDEAERTYAFARAQGLKVHGHALFWYKHPLVGAQSEKTLDAAVDLYGKYFAAVMRRFPDTMSWDVFNEIVGTDKALRTTFPIARFGAAFIEKMLRKARELAPDARLVINENDLECDAASCEMKRANALKLLRALRKRGAPLDAIGIQAHLSSRNTPSPGATRAFIRKVEDLGLDVYISEMDVDDVDLDADISRRDEQVAELYSSFLTTVLKSRAVKRIAFWGLTDAENWIANGEAKVRRDGKPARPTLFDRQFGRKPAYFAVREALRTATAR